MPQRIDSSECDADFYTIVLPKEGGGIRQVDLNGESWRHPDYSTFHKRLQALGPGTSLEFSADAFGTPASVNTTYNDGTVHAFTEDSGERRETIKFPGGESMLIFMTRSVPVSRFKGEIDTSWARKPEINPFT